MGYGYTGVKCRCFPVGAVGSFWNGCLSDGNRLAVGAYTGDGNANILEILERFISIRSVIPVFNGAILESRIGAGYTGGKNYNMTGILGSNDYFGKSVSLDGNRLAVGAYGGDGLGKHSVECREVYLFLSRMLFFKSGSSSNNRERIYWRQKY